MAKKFVLLILLTLTAAHVCADDRQIETGFSSRSVKPVLVKTVSPVKTSHQNTQSLLKFEDGVSRRDWQFIVVHHSATSQGSVESIHREHRQRTDASGNPWLGIGYHFVIGNGKGMPDGSTKATFRWRQQLHGAHSGNALYNGKGIGICVIGNFEQTPPSAQQIQAATVLIRDLTDRYQILPTSVIGHNQIKATQCPGRLFPLNRIIRNATGDTVDE